MPTGHPLTYGVALQTQRALKAANWSRIDAAKALKIKESTLKSRVNIIREAYPQLLIEPGDRGRLNPDRTIDEDLQIKKAEDSKRASEAKYRDAMRQLGELQQRISEMEFAGNVRLEPEQWTFVNKPDGKKAPHIPCLFFSDAQAGEVVRPDETDAPWPYDSNIFAKRYRHMIRMTLDLALNHGGRRWSYPGVIYVRGGDNISGGLHEDLRELGEDSTVIQQCELVAEEEAQGIRNLATGFGKVEVKTPGASGNHDRNTLKPRSKLAWARTYDRLIHRMLVLELKNDKRVTFEISKSPDIRFPIFNKTVCVTHGDKMGTGGGLGFSGPSLPIMRGWHKVHLEQARLGFHVDEVWNGHHHYPFYVPNYGKSNGSFTGYTEYGKTLRATPTPPLQYLDFWHTIYGCVDSRPIYLAAGQ
jgi:hypothetical protein